MTCTELRELYSDYSDGALEPEKAARFEAHLQECPDCAAEYENFRHLLDELHSLPEPPLPEQLHETMTRRVRETFAKTRAETGNTPVKPRLLHRKGTASKSARPFVYAAAGVAASFILLSVLVTGISGVINASGRRGAFERMEMANTFNDPPGLPVDAGISGNAMYKTASDELTFLNGEPDDPDAAGNTDLTATADTPTTLADTASTATGGAAPYVNAVVGNDLSPMLAAQYCNQRFEISITVDDMRTASMAVSQLSGYNVDSGIRYNEYGGSYGSYTRRVEVSAYAYAKNALRALGEVTNETESVIRLADEVYDLQARLSAKQQETERLTALLSESRTMDVLTAVEGRLGAAESERDDLRGRLNQLYDTTAYPTIIISLYEAPPESVPIPDDTFGERLRQRFIRSLNASIAFMENFVVFLTSVFIPLLVIAAFAALAWTIVKASRRKRRAEKMPPAEIPPESSEKEERP